MENKYWNIIYIILLLTIIIYLRYRIVYEPSKYKISFDELKSKAKSGDLILFSHYPKKFLKRMRIYANQTIIGSKYTHIGIIHKKNGELYVCEITAKNKEDEQKYGNVTGKCACYPIENRIKKYEGSVTVRFLNKPLTDNQEKILDVEISNLKDDFVKSIDDHMLNHCMVKKLCPICTPKKKKGMFCSEYVATLLKKIGVLNKNMDTLCAIPQDFVQNKDKIVYEPGYSYSKEYDVTF